MTIGTWRAVWNSKPVEEWRRANFDPVWIYDGQKIAWYVVRLVFALENKVSNTAQEQDLHAKGL